MKNKFCYKKSKALLPLILVSNLLFAQESGKTRFEDSLANDFCDVFAKAAPGIKKENIQMELGVLILPLFSKYKDQISAHWKLDADDPQDAEKIGEKVGQIGVLGCPAFLAFIKNNMDVVKDDMEVSKTLKTKFVKVEGSPFAYLLTRNPAGKTEKFYWMEFFEGADLLATPAKLVNKQIKIHYKEVEIYDNTIKDYKVIKVATGLELNP